MKKLFLSLAFLSTSFAFASTTTCENDNGFEKIASIKMGDTGGNYTFHYFEQMIIGERPVTIELSNDQIAYTCDPAVNGFDGFHCFNDAQISENEFRRISISFLRIPAEITRAHIEVRGTSYIVDRQGTWIRNDFESDTHNFGREDFYDCKTEP